MFYCKQHFCYMETMFCHLYMLDKIGPRRRNCTQFTINFTQQLEINSIKTDCLANYTVVARISADLYQREEMSCENTRKKSLLYNKGIYTKSRIENYFRYYQLCQKHQPQLRSRRAYGLFLSTCTVVIVDFLSEFGIKYNFLCLGLLP